MQEEMLKAAHDNAIDIDEFFGALPDFTKVHSRHVAELTASLLLRTQQAGLLDETPLPYDEKQIKHAILYHDIGMALIPERLLLKRDDLTSAEKRVVQRHAKYGAKLLERYRKGPFCQEDQSDFWRFAANIAASHHERWDGQGYPFGLIATAIPIAARAAAIANAYDAIVSGSTFRMALPHEYAILEISDNSGAQFDPTLVDVFLRNADELCAQITP